MTLVFIKKDGCFGVQMARVGTVINCDSPPLTAKPTEADLNKHTKPEMKTILTLANKRITNWDKANKGECATLILRHWDDIIASIARKNGARVTNTSEGNAAPTLADEEQNNDEESSEGSSDEVTEVTVFGDDRVVTDIFELAIDDGDTILNLKEKIADMKGFDITKLHLWQFSTYAVGDTVPEDIGNELPDTNLACETNIHEGLQIHLMIDEGKAEDDIRDFCELDENGDYLFSADFLKKWDDDEADPVIMLNVTVTTMKGNTPLTLTVPDYTTVRSFKDLVSDKINVKAGKFVLNSELFYLTCGGQSMETINATLKDYIDDDSRDLEVVLVLRLKGGGKRRKNEDESVQHLETDPDEVKLLLQTFGQKWGRADFEQMCLSPQVTLEMLDEMVKASKGGCRPDFRAGKILSCVPQVKAIEDGGFNTPRSGFNTPRSGFNTPRSGFNTPRSGFNTPRSGFNTPRSGFNTPRSGFNSAPIGCPRPLLASAPLCSDQLR